MARPKNGIPSLRLHKASGQAVVTIDGHNYYLGQWGKHATMVKYRRAIGDLASEQAEQALRIVLDDAKNESQRLEKDLWTLEESISKVKESIWMLEELINGKMPLDDRYPMPPEPVGTCGIDDVPSVSGIYFLHNIGGIEYVGKSNDLRTRIGLSNFLRHHVARPNDRFSYLEFPVNQLLFVECYYIWLVKPVRNFGGDKHDELACLR